jgi:pullulanase
MTDYILYELHVRDLTTHQTWGGNPEYAGTFMGVAQSGTTYTDENGLTVTTGLDHLAELGINAVHFLPIFDYGYVDETKLDDEALYECLRL